MGPKKNEKNQRRRTRTEDMLILQIWLAGSLLFAAFWALAGLLIGEPGPVGRTHRGARAARHEIAPQGEAA